MAEVKKLLASKKKDKGTPADDLLTLYDYLRAAEDQMAAARQAKDLTEGIEKAVLAQYAKLDEETIRQIVVHEKWEAALGSALHGLQDRISQALTRRIKQLAERYETTLPELEAAASDFESKVKQHLAAMGF